MSNDVGMPSDTKSNMPCCGVAASAMASDKSFNEIWQMIKRIGRKDDTWDGTCSFNEILLPIIASEKMFQDVPIKLGLFGFLNDILLFWVNRQSKRNTIYLVITYNKECKVHHALIVYNGKAFDQNHLKGAKINDYGGMGDEVIQVFKITEYNSNKKVK